MEGEADSWDFGVGMLLLTCHIAVKQSNFMNILSCMAGLAFI